MLSAAQIEPNGARRSQVELRHYNMWTHDVVFPERATSRLSKDDWSTDFKTIRQPIHASSLGKIDDNTGLGVDSCLVNAARWRLCLFMPTLGSWNHTNLLVSLNVAYGTSPSKLGY